MILSNIELLKALENGRIVIDPKPPLPTMENPANPYDTTAVDLTLAPHLEIPKDDYSVAIDISKGGIAETLSTLCDQITIPESGYILEPKKFVLAQTKEKIKLPIHEEGPVFAARVEGKSSRARCGILIHFTAPTVHAGFEGPLTLEMINLHKYDFILKPGMAICQLIFEQVLGTPTRNPSQFQGQSTPSGVTHT